MRQIWELFRVLWIVGSLPVGVLLLIVVVLCGFNLPFFLGFAGGADPAIRWLFWVLAFYFVGGGWLFWLVNQRYAEKLKRLVSKDCATHLHRCHQHGVLEAQGR